MVTIYKMLDPDTKQIRYIGKTTQTMKQRLYNHLHGKQSGHEVNTMKFSDEIIREAKELIELDRLRAENARLRNALKLIAATTGRNGHTATRIVDFAKSTLEGLTNQEVNP